MINEEDKRIIERVQKINCDKGDILLFYFKLDQFFDIEELQSFYKNIRLVLPEDASVIMLPDKIQLFCIEQCESMIKRLQNYISQIQEAMDKVRNIKNEGLWHDVILDFKDGGIRQRDFYTCGSRIIGQE